MDGVPTTVRMPKFLTPADIERVKELKSDIPELTWVEAINEVILDERKQREMKDAALQNQ